MTPTATSSAALADRPESSETQPRSRTPRGQNRVELLGRLARDPELHFTPDGVPVSTLRVATNDTTPPQYHDVVVWRGTAEFVAKYLSSGRLVWIAGRIHRRIWEGDDGSRHDRVEINAFELQVLDRAPNGAQPDGVVDEADVAPDAD